MLVKVTGARKNMSHEKTVRNTRRFLKRAQDWVDKTPGAVSVSTKINSRDVTLAEKKHGQC